METDEVLEGLLFDPQYEPRDFRLQQDPVDLSFRLRSVEQLPFLSQSHRQISSVKFLTFARQRAQRCATEALICLTPTRNDGVELSDEGLEVADAADYTREVHEFKTHQETKLRWTQYRDYVPGLIETQRSLLTDIVIAIHIECRMHPAALHIAFHLMDWYLTKKRGLHRMGLIGLCSLRAAFRFQHSRELKNSFISFILFGVYSDTQIDGMEKEIMATINWKYGIPTAYEFARFYLTHTDGSKELTDLTCYLLELGLRQYSLLRVLPSKLAAAAIYIACSATQREPWPYVLQAHSGYQSFDVIFHAQILLHHHLRMQIEKDGMCFIKYKNDHFSNAADQDCSPALLELESRPDPSQPIKVYRHQI